MALMSKEASAEKSRRPRKTRENNKVFAKLFQSYNTSAEAATCRVKRSRKVLYVLSNGTLNSSACLQADKSRHLLIPNGYTVTFEAYGQVWLARCILYRRNIKGKEEISLPGYEILPVDFDGQEIAEKSSGIRRTASSAFRYAIESFWGQEAHKDLYRPNGRLYVGIHYEDVQERLRDYFSTNKNNNLVVDCMLSSELENWLQAYSTPESEDSGYDQEGEPVSNPSKEHYSVDDTLAKMLVYNDESFLEGFDAEPIDIESILEKPSKEKRSRGEFEIDPFDYFADQSFDGWLHESCFFEPEFKKLREISL